MKKLYILLFMGMIGFSVLAQSGNAEAIKTEKEIIQNVLLCFFAGGHVLLEGVPGLGKTVLVKTMGEACNLNFSRIQFR